MSNGRLRRSVEQLADSGLLSFPAAFPPPAGKHDDGTPLNRSNDGEGTLPGEEHVDKNAFDHPATYEASS